MITNPLEWARNHAQNMQADSLKDAHNGFDWLSNRSSGRSLGLTILGARGSGKSFPTFKELCWGDLNAGIPQLILDPVGSSAYLLDKVWRARSSLPKDDWWKLAKKIVYLNFGASDQDEFVPQWPLLFRWQGESYYQVSQRPIDLIAALSPELEGAAVEGMNAIREVGTHTFIILSILGLQLTEAQVLLTQTKQCDKDWGWFDEALSREPIQAASSVRYFRNQYLKLKPEMKERRTKSLLNQLGMFQSDPVMRAMFGASHAPPWETWEAQGMCVIADFQGIHDLNRRRWCMMAVYDQFLAYKLSRGLRSPPWSLVLEELTQWIPDGGMGEVMATKLDALLNVYARNYQIYVTTISQELFQMPPRLQEVLLAAGNLMIGNQASAGGRQQLVEYFFPYTGHALPPKRYEPVYVGGEIVDYRPIDFSMGEYMALMSEVFVLPGWRFWVKAARKEGDTSGGLESMHIHRNRGEWVQEDSVAKLTNLVSAWSGGRQQQILTSVEARRGPLDCTLDQEEPMSSSESQAEDTETKVEVDTRPDAIELPPGVEVIKGGFQPGQMRKYRGS